MCDEDHYNHRLQGTVCISFVLEDLHNHGLIRA
jgi:hypothetical protein